MEALISQFTLLSDQALTDKNFDPSTIQDLLKLFEIEAYNSWAAMELHHQAEARDAETAMQEAEDYLDSVMDDAMDEFRRFEEEFDRIAEAELRDLVDKSEKARRMGGLMEKAAAVASKRYMEAAMNSATASMKSAWKAVSSENSPGLRISSRDPNRMLLSVRNDTVQKRGIQSPSLYILYVHNAAIGSACTR